MVAAIVAASFLILPGYTIVALTKRTDSRWADFVDAIVWSTFLTSAVFWLWPLQAIRLDTWFFVCLGLSALGLAIVLFKAVRNLGGPGIEYPKAERLPLIVAIVVVCAFILVNLIVRPSIDWDALNYYLFVALGFTNANHVGMTLPTSIIVTPNTPNGITPLLPTIYAVAIEASAFFKGSADASVHLIPFVFFLGTIVATRRLAARFMPSVAADAAALFVAIMPAILNYYTGNPLYVDGATVFLIVSLANELYRFGSDPLQGARIGALFTLLILSKANGFVLVSFIVVVLLAGMLGKLPGRLLIGAFSVAMVVAAGVLHEYDRVSSIGLWVAIPLTAAVCIAYVQPMQLRLGSLSREAIWAALFTVPGAYYMYALSKAAGSPAGFFVPSLIHVKTPNYHWALGALDMGGLYSVASQPGLPENFPVGLLLWWGFSPFINCLAILGAMYAYKRIPRIRPIVLLVALFYLGWLTIFNLTSFRHLLPVLPFLCVLAAFALTYLLRERWAQIVWAAMGVVVLSVPFAWTAQLGMYEPPLVWLNALSLDPYHSLSGQALLWILLYFLSVCGVIALYRVMPPAARQWSTLNIFAFCAFGAALFSLLYTNVIAGVVFFIIALLLAGVGWLHRLGLLDARLGPWAAVVAALFAAAATFEPLIAAAVSPGLVVQSDLDRNNEDFGYVPALQYAMNIGSEHGSILTYQGYGVTWYSAGRYRRIDLTDAFELGLLRDDLQSQNAEKLLRHLKALDAFASILPGPDLYNPYASFRRMMTRADLPALHAFEDPMLAPVMYEGPKWTTRRIMDLSTSFDRNAQVRLEYAGNAVAALAIQTPRTLAKAAGSLTVHGTILNGGKEVMTDFTFARRATPSRVPAVTPRELLSSSGLSREDRRSARILAIDWIEYKPEDSTAVLDWRSPRFRMHYQGGKWTQVPSNLPFYLHPEIAPIAFVEIRGKDPTEPSAFSIYPGGLRNDDQWQHDVLAIGLRDSSACPKGAPMQIDVRTAWGSIRIRARAGDTPLVPIESDFAGASSERKVAIQSITVRGIRSNCNISQRLTAVPLERNAANMAYIVPDGIEPLAVTALNVP